MIAMQKSIVLSLAAILLVSGCARFDVPVSSSNSSASSQSTISTQAATIAPSDEFTDEGILSFLPSDIVAKLSAREKSEAASAQFFALQYGRVGATREWTADSATRGEISVGPYIKVNKLDCREFTHTVVLGGERHSKTGTSCREQDGQWAVVG